MAYENRNKLSIVKAYAEAAGVEIGDHSATEIHWKDEDDKWVDEFLKPGSWCAVHAGPTTWKGKNWDDVKWRETLTALRKDFGFKIVLIGHGESIPYPCDRDARGVTTSNRCAALLSKCKLMIGLDSFPIHLAQAVGTPVVGLFGVTLPHMILTEGSSHAAVTGSPSAPDYGIRHAIPGQTSVKSDGYAMASITVEQVLEAVQSLAWKTGKKRKMEAVS
jgi:ADP-heptose:LPS heptosyltransferase